MKLDKEKFESIFECIPINNDHRIVLLEPSVDNSWDKEDIENNIYRLDNQGSIIWRINASSSSFSVDKNYSEDSFVYVYLNNEILIAKRFFGTKYEINITTGVASEIGWEK